jgi:16S rRNA processing protein RimM
MSNKNLIIIAYSSSSHGIKGEFSVKLINDESVTLKPGQKIYIKKKNSEQFIEKEILSIKYGNKVIMRINGIDTKTDSDSMVPFEIFIDKKNLPELDEEEFYLFDLIGLEVVNDETSEVVGTVKDFYDSPAHTIIQVETKTRQLIDIIFNDNFIKEVNLETGCMRVVVPIEVE